VAASFSQVEDSRSELPRQFIPPFLTEITSTEISAHSVPVCKPNMATIQAFSRREDSHRGGTLVFPPSILAEDYRAAFPPLQLSRAALRPICQCVEWFIKQLHAAPTAKKFPEYLPKSRHYQLDILPRVREYLPVTQAD
jgi:hypothetical protein